MIKYKVFIIPTGELTCMQIKHYEDRLNAFLAAKLIRSIKVGVAQGRNEILVFTIQYE